MERETGRSTSVSNQDRICKKCNRTMATTSPEGDLVPLMSRDSACDMCTPFEELYAVMQTKDEAFLALESRRFDHLPRYHAMEESKAAHKALDNFLLQTEMQITPKMTLHTHSNAPGSLLKENAVGFATNEGQEQLRPQSEEDNRQRTVLSSLCAIPVKRSRPTLDEQRRVSFDSGVVFYDKESGRPDEAFSRSSKDYVRGRNAPTEGYHFLDTSGLSTTATRFFGIKKHRKGWVETKEGKEMDAQWINEKTAERSVHSSSQDHTAGLGKDTRQGDQKKSDDDPENTTAV
ncbi:unnamed protein product [Periconia digitata]|uniref:Uncharacterized protein n=1 Tax=Periconia digitata TaxID=1303443 RepID=A0A9W4UH34_9PLEO|nr:unnamed protein product [Periconia digitata]